MPASSISSLTSWAVYLFATFTLALFLVPFSQSAMHQAQESSALSVARGFDGVLGTLRPGDMVSVSYDSPYGGFDIVLGGDHVGYSLDGASVLLPCNCTVQRATLLPSQEYTLALDGGMVEVRLDVRG